MVPINPDVLGALLEQAVAAALAGVGPLQVAWIDARLQEHHGVVPPDVQSRIRAALTAHVHNAAAWQQVLARLG